MSGTSSQVLILQVHIQIYIQGYIYMLNSHTDRILWQFLPHLVW